MNKFGLLGGKISHSFSPQIHSIYGDYEYKMFSVEEQELDAFFTKRNFDGINVTIPYKKAVIPYCNSLSLIASRLQSVNTITVAPNGTLHGDNTDYIGFSFMLKKAGIRVKGKKVLVLGNGGSSLTVCAVCEDEGANEIIVVSRIGSVNYDNLHLHSNVEIIINCTPVGMYPNNGNCHVNLGDYPKCEAVADLIYNPQKTALILQAEKLGLNYVNGMTMLAAQAKVSSEMFTGIKLNDNLIENAVEIVSKSTQNIVLIGMPGCGKSSVGIALSEKLKKGFLDTDEMVFESTRKKPSDIIRNDGEVIFREIEKISVAEAGKTTASVIATGGGVILDERNIDALRQNGVIIFLERDINKLEIVGRPLSFGENAIQKLYEYRLPLYKKYADFIIDCNDSIDETAEKILTVIKN